MRAVVQRVHWAKVSVSGTIVGQIEQGLLVYLGVRSGDTAETVAWIARKIAGLRIFPNQNGRFDRSVRDVNGSVLVVSQFTLYGDISHGYRPDFTAAAPPAEAEPLYQLFISKLRNEYGLPVQTGVFGAMMDVECANWGPVTIILEKESSLPQ
ncbi:MAG: D-aminoacyl-tRNA deacylase [Bacteroidota bacterium]|nr:D-aminoacyl-tRNA deacylase [Candidatus Kapabacteria bacterium]MCX7937128.1 D-aminoacyl-tRNA deacylase [Chlorobiota bacterium]MDW8270903.1 D-aminoacyl-tRNA deacylase [Bacteroidota bacterium]